MKILVLGGTGAMGSHLVGLLSKTDAEVVVTSRSSHSGRGNISYLCGNAHNRDFMQHALSLASWDVVVDFMVYTTAEFADRVKMLLASTKQYVFLSSARVFADSKQPITENSPRLLEEVDDVEYLATDEYALSKARQENMLRESGDNWTIIRPYITYDNYRLQLGQLEKEAWLYRALHNRSIVVSKQLLSCVTTMTSGFDVAKCMVELLGNKEAYSQSFNITGRQGVEWSEVLNLYVSTLSKLLNREVKVFVSDYDLSVKYGAKYQMIYDRFYNRTFDNSKICAYLPESDFISWRDGLEQCLKEFVANPKFGTIYWAIEGRKDRLAGEFTPLKEIKGVKNKVKYLLARLLNM